MSEFLEEYLRRGLRDIVVIEQRSQEDDDWHATEDHYETTVARKGGSFMRLEAHQRLQFGPRGDRYIEVTGQHEISNDGYRRLAANRPAIDTETERRKVAARQHDLEQARRIKESLES